MQSRISARDSPASQEWPLMPRSWESLGSQESRWEINTLLTKAMIALGKVEAARILRFLKRNKCLRNRTSSLRRYGAPSGADGCGHAHREGNSRPQPAEAP